MEDFYTQLTGELHSLFGDRLRSNFFSSQLLNTVFRYTKLLTEGEKAFENDTEQMVYKDHRASEVYFDGVAQCYNYFTVLTGCGNGYDGSIAECITNNPDYVELKTSNCPINRFLSSSPQFSRVFVNANKKNVIVTTSSERPSEKWFIRMLSALPRIMSWVFTTDELRQNAFFKHLYNENVEEMQTMIKELCDKVDVRKSLLTKSLSGYGKTFLSDDIATLKNRNSSLMSTIRDYQESIAGALDNISENNIKIQSLVNVVNGMDGDMVLNFFLQRPSLYAIPCSSNGKCPYGIITTIEYYDEDEYKRCIDSYLIEYSNEVRQKYRKFLDSIFLERKGKFRTKSEFMLTKLSSIRPIKEGCEYSTRYDNILPHPHLAFYGCLGGNEGAITQYLLDGNWDMAIDQTIGATKNLCFTDSAVISRFINYVHNNWHLKMIEYGDQYLSPEEYYKIVFEGDNSNEQEN